MVIDTHVHFWKYNSVEHGWIDDSMKILKKNYLPEDIALTLKRNGVDGCVAVQAATKEVETRFLCELAETHPIIRGVVGWTDLQSAGAERSLQEFSTYPLIKGIRHIVQSEPDDFLYNQEFRRGVSLLAGFGFTYDILIFHRQLPAAVDLVSAFPRQQFILDHCAKPDIRNKEMDSWKKNIQALAAHPNVCCKLSGLLTEANWNGWSPGDFYPYLDVIFAAFGTERLLFGSDWPVMLLSGIYVQWKSLLEKYMEGHPPEEKENVFGLNAQRVYNLT